MEASLTSAMVLYCGSTRCVKAVRFFRGGAPSWMFGKILNVTLTNNLLLLVEALFLSITRRNSEENLSTTGITQGNLEFNDIHPNNN